MKIPVNPITPANAQAIASTSGIAAGLGDKPALGILGAMVVTPPLVLMVVFPLLATAEGGDVLVEGLEVPVV